MQRRPTTPLLVGLLVAGFATAAAAQQPQSQFLTVTDLHIAPGKAGEFEILLKNRNARMQKGKVAFGTLVAVNEDGVYRQVTLLGNDMWATRDKLQSQIDAMPEMSPGIKTPIEDVIVGIDQSVRRTRPDLAYTVETPRVPDKEIGFAHEIRLYLKVGANEGIERIIKRVAAVRATHKIADPFFVSQQVAGSDGPLMTVTAVARNAADFYTESEKINKMLAKELEPILQEGASLLRRVEAGSYLVRQDLAYQPPGN